MDHRRTLKAISLELRHLLEGQYDKAGRWQPGDLEQRLASIGIWRERIMPADELPHLTPTDHNSRRVLDTYLRVRKNAGQDHATAVAEFIREAAYTWANRLLTLRCMESREIIDEVIYQRQSYGGRSLEHYRLIQRNPQYSSAEDEGLFEVLETIFRRYAIELPQIFDPASPSAALRPSISVLQRCIAILSGSEALNSDLVASSEVFAAADAIGWAYQYWNTEEKERVLRKIRTKKGAKIEGAEIIPATCIYTDSYIVKFLMQNSLGALWLQMCPESRLPKSWDFYLHQSETRSSKKTVSEITFLDPACGSGHFLLEAFELFYQMYLDEGTLQEPNEICSSILEHNLFGIDIDERAIQIASLALVLKAKEKAPDFIPKRLNLVATDICLPQNTDHLEDFLAKHPDDRIAREILSIIFSRLSDVNQLGSLLKLEEELEHQFQQIRNQNNGDKQGVADTSIDWKFSFLDRLHQHFHEEASVSDDDCAMIYNAAAKALIFAEHLARRYDVVAANPPYLGSRNMGETVKEYVQTNYKIGKRDLYSAFVFRCLDLTRPGGRSALLTPESWMFLDGWKDLRKVILKKHGLPLVAHLGPRTFKELSNSNALGFTMFVVRSHDAGKTEPVFLRAVKHDDKELAVSTALQAARRSHWGHTSLTYKSKVDTFLNIEHSPIFYWAPKAIYDAFAGGNLFSKHFDAKQGLITGENLRFLRRFWEVSDVRWQPYMKGGAYRRWFGNTTFVVNWSEDGAAIKSLKTPKGKQKSRPQNLRYYFQPGATWTGQSSYGLSFRLMPSGFIFDAKGPAFFERTDESFDLYTWLAVTNSVVVQFCFRGIQPTIDYHEGYLLSLPAPNLSPADATNLRKLAEVAIRLKQFESSFDPRERNFDSESFYKTTGSSLRQWALSLLETIEGAQSVVHACEGEINRIVADAYKLNDSDLVAIAADWGTPAGRFSMIASYSAVPSAIADIALPTEILEMLLPKQTREIQIDELAAMKANLASLYEKGMETDETAEETDAEIEDEEPEEEVTASETHVPVETLLERLSQKCQIHPISTHLMLKEFRCRENFACDKRLVQLVENYVSVLVLKLLGYSWPNHGGTPDDTGAEWIDGDGVIPLIDGAGEPALWVRVRNQLAIQFGLEHVSNVEQEFQSIVGKSLQQWLTTDFFPKHISQFAGRPVAWQLQSTPRQSARKRKDAEPTTPAFSCLVNCHKLDADLLPKLRHQYLGPLRSRLQTELNGLTKIETATVEQEKRKLRIESLLDELKDFDVAIHGVIAAGFACPSLLQTAQGEPLDRWTSKDGIATPPSSKDVFITQEQAYDPDINDGVRVNIAPLQKAGLLMTDCLSNKDVDKAISDRVQWRLDERKNSRLRVITRPTWWKVSDSTRTEEITCVT